jgi:hypothetical protein
MTSGEFKKMKGVIGGVAISLNEDMEGVGKSWLAFRKQNIDLTKVLGSKGTTGAVRDLTKVTSVYGIEGEQLANISASLVKSFGFTEEGVGNLMDKVFVIGKRFNVGAEAIQAWPSILESINKESADFGRKLTPEEIDKLTTSMVALGGGFSKSMGIGGQQAMELARTTFDTLAGERKNILDMFRTGELGPEFGTIAKQLFETGGDVQGVFKMMSEGDPLKFMDMIREMAKVAETKGGDTGIAFQRLTKTISDTLGPDVSFAMKGNWDRVTDSIKGIPELLADPKTKGAFMEWARLNFRTGRTMGDNWQLMVDQARARLFKLSDKDVGQWTKRMGKGFKTTGDMIGKFAKDDGPIGKLTRKFLLVSRVGLSGLFEGMGQLAPLFQGLGDSMFPMMTALGSMGIKFSSLGKMAVGGGALYGLFYLLKHGPEETVKKLNELKDTVINFGHKYFPEFTEKALAFVDKIKTFDFGSAFESIKDAFVTITDKIPFGKIKDSIVALWEKINWPKVFEWAAVKIGELAEFVGGLIGKMFREVDVLGLAWDLAKSIGSVITTALKEAFSEKNLEAGEMAQASLGGAIGRAIVAGLKYAKDEVKEGAQDLINGIVHPSQLKDSMGNLSNTIIGGTAVALAVSGGFRKKFVGLIGKTFKGAKTLATKGMGGQGFVGTIRSGLGKSSVAMKGFESTAVSGMGRTAGAMGKASGAIKGIAKFAKFIPKAGMIGGFIGAIEQAHDRAESIARVMMDDAIPSIEKFGLVGAEVFTGILHVVDDCFFGIPGMVGEALDLSEKDVKLFYHMLVASSQNAVDFIVTDAKIVAEQAKLYFFALGDEIGNLWDVASLSIQGTLNELVPKVNEISWKMSDSMKNAADRASLAWTSITSVIEDALGFMAHKIKGWSADLIEMLVGTPEKPTAFSTFIGDLLGEKAKGILSSMREFGKGSRKEYETAGGDKYWEMVTQKRTEAASARQREVDAAALGRIGKTNEQIKKQAEAQAVTTADIAYLQGQATGQIGEALTEAHVEGLGYGLSEEMGFNERSEGRYDVGETAFTQGEAVQRGAAQARPEIVSASKLKAALELSAAKREQDAKEKRELEETLKRIREAKKGKGVVPTAAERAESAVPSSNYHVSGLLNSVTNLTAAMANFTANPLKLNLAVEGDIGKFLKFSEKREMKNVHPSLR